MGLVHLEVQLEVRADLEHLAADDEVRAQTAAGVHLALALAILQLLPGSLEEDERVLARHHLQAWRDAQGRGAHEVGEVGHVDGVALRPAELGVEIEDGHGAAAQARAAHRSRSAIFGDGISRTGAIGMGGELSRCRDLLNHGRRQALFEIWLGGRRLPVEIAGNALIRTNETGFNWPPRSFQSAKLTFWPSDCTLSRTSAFPASEAD